MLLSAPNLVYYPGMRKMAALADRLNFLCVSKLYAILTSQDIKIEKRPIFPLYRLKSSSR